MKPEEIEALLKQTLEDRRLTRGEKRALGSVLDDAGADAADLAVYRSRAFDIARAEIDHPKSKEVLDWLEDVVKLLQPASAKPQAQKKHYAEVHFSPKDDCPTRINALIQQALRSIDICVFTITDNRISREIEDAHRRGVRVRIITDDEKAQDRGSDVDDLRDKGIPVRIDSSPSHMHHKFAIFDAEVLLTGSYNWTRSAAMHNQENFLVTADERLVNPFRQTFETLWESFA